MNKLEEICAKKKEHIARKKKQISENALEDKISSLPPTRKFFQLLKSKADKNEIGLIAEVKKASPSKGIIRQEFNHREIAINYQNGGATCVSVLTDEPYFQGKDDFLEEIKQEISLPILRKDFMLDTYQIIESRALGADCILLIMAALSNAQANELEQAAIEYKMDVLIEVHNEKELDRAMDLRSNLIGINNRDLKTLNVDLATTEKLVPRLSGEKLPVCESGISINADIKRMQKVGVNCFLVGESLMKENDVLAATKKLLGK